MDIGGQQTTASFVPPFLNMSHQNPMLIPAGGTPGSFHVEAAALSCCSRYLLEAVMYQSASKESSAALLQITATQQLHREQCVGLVAPLLITKKSNQRKSHPWGNWASMFLAGNWDNQHRY